MDFDQYFVKSDLIPAIVVEESTGQVLMLAYMNRESLQKTVETDCDNDTLLVKVEQIGAACHTGHHSCFYKQLLPVQRELEE